MVSLMNSRSASANGDNNLQSAEPFFVAANRVGEITGATPVFVAVSRHKYLFLAPIVAAGVAPLGLCRSIYPRGVPEAGSNKSIPIVR